MSEYALRLESGTDTAPRVRLGDTLALAPNGPLTGQGGIRPDGGGEVIVTPGTMQVTVTAFLGWVDGGVSVAQGGYTFVLDTDKVLTLADGDAGQDRTDTICARVRDNAFDASGVTLADVYVLEGTPGAGAASVPAGHEALRDVIVPAGVSLGTGGLSSTALSTDRRRYTAALGGILEVTGAAQRDALTDAVRAVWRRDTKTLEVFDDFQWQTVPFGSATDTWHTVGGAGEPGFASAWGNQSGWSAQFTKNSAGAVYMRGLVTGGAAGTRVFSLPVGYRPNVLITIGTLTLNGPVRLNIGADGQVIPTAAGSQSFTTADWVDLCVSFQT